MNKPVIFFDCFGVIFAEVAPVWLRKYFDEETAVKVKADIFPLADIGILNEEETFNRLSDVTKVPVDRIKSEWDEIIILNDKMIELILSLKKEYEVYMLSNAIASFLRTLLKKYNIYSLFKKIYISSDMKIIKPNKEYFEYVLNDLKITDGNAIMIDDNKSNIDGAKEAGIKGIVYSSVEQLKRELILNGVRADL